MALKQLLIDIMRHDGLGKYLSINIQSFRLVDYKVRFNLEKLDKLCDYCVTRNCPLWNYHQGTQGYRQSGGAGGVSN